MKHCKTTSHTCAASDCHVNRYFIDHLWSHYSLNHGIYLHFVGKGTMAFNYVFADAIVMSGCTFEREVFNLNVMHFKLRPN